MHGLKARRSSMFTSAARQAETGLSRRRRHGAENRCGKWKPESVLDPSKGASQAADGA
jgi:hypothetical protein